jgi:DNA-binding NtrC family response regulator
MATTVSIIEAEGTLRENLARRLRLEGFDIVDTGGTGDLEQMPNSEPADIFLLGLDGLGEKGLSLLRIIRNRWPLVPVILMSRPGQLNTSIAAMKLGAFDEILIPFDMATLLERIEKARVGMNQNNRAAPGEQSECGGGRNRL